MKITRNEKQFEPISITLESQMEVDALNDALYLMKHNTRGMNEGVDFISTLGDQISLLSSNSDSILYYKNTDGFVFEAEEI